METVSEIVLWQLVFLAFNGDLALVDAVGITSYRRTEVAWRILDVGILCDVVIAKNHVGGLAVLVGHHERYPTCTEVGDTHFHAVTVLQRVKSGLLSVDYRIELCRIQTRNGLGSLLT